MTLVEVMTVLFIIGLTAGIVTLTMPERPTREQASAQAFAEVLRDAQTQAILVGQPVGLTLGDRTYRLVRWRGEQWRPQGDPFQLPRSVDIALEAAAVERSEAWPDIVFGPTGIVQPSRFELRGPGVRIDINLIESGEVEIVER